MKRVFTVMGQDARQQAAERTLRRRGCRVQSETAAGADCLLLPFAAAEPQQLAAAKPGGLVFGGSFSPNVIRCAGNRGLRLVDCLADPGFAERNAVPTAEGALLLLLQNRTRTLRQSPVLVLGFGRVGRVLTDRLLALGARVTVAARSAGQCAQAEGMGADSIPLCRMGELLPFYETAVNTIPAPVLGQEQLRLLPQGSFILDLASAPGGTDFAAARQLGLRALHAPGLPGRFFPDTAGTLYAETVLEWLNQPEKPENSCTPENFLLK